MPPEFLRLAGHPVRWRLLDELSRSDRRVDELTGLVGELQFGCRAALGSQVGESGVA